MPKLARPEKAKKALPPPARAFEVQETAKGFEVALPSAGFGESVATKREFFSSREEAEKAAVQGREDARLFREQASLAKTYSPTFERIDPLPDGRFQVTLPGPVDSSTGYFVGITSTEFSTWDEARRAYLAHRESREQLTHKPILELRLNDRESIAFSALDAFRPRVAPSEKSASLPAAVETYLAQHKKREGADPSAKTYQETVKKEGWEKDMWKFVSTYAKKDEGRAMKELGIERLEALTPKQAVELATRVVIEHAKYKWSDARAEAGTPDATSYADTHTALDLLEAGRARKNDPTWEGNGICRNFASTVKAVFEALKANQTRFNYLRDTYCLYESGTSAYAPTRKKGDSIKLDGHAWNTFVTVSREGAANAVSVDATWAKQNLETGKVEGLDYTLTRMEPMIHEMVRALPETAPEREGQINHALSYYLLKMESPTGVPGMSSPEQERWFFASRALDLLRTLGVPQRLSPGMAAKIGDECLAHAGELDKSEIETIQRLARRSSRVPFSGILRQYLEGKTLNEHGSRQCIFADDALQRQIFDQLQVKGKAERFLKESPSFRARMREALPGIVPAFDPMKREEDAAELNHLIRNSRYLESRFSRFTMPGHWQKEGGLAAFYQKARDLLRTTNPEQFDSPSSSLGDYQVIKRFDALMNQLKQKA